MRTLVALLCLSFIGCDAKLVVPTGPTPDTTEAGSQLVVRGRDTLRTEQADLFVAEVLLTNGSTGGARRPEWSTSDESVASVTQEGVVTARNQGSATITAKSLGLVAQKPVQVWQNYHGTWMGTHTVRGCVNTVNFSPSWCSTFPEGTSQPFVLTLIQNETELKGTLTLGVFQGPIEGGIVDDRHFVGRASLSALVNGILYSSIVGTFDMLVAGDDREGHLTAETRSSGLSGYGYLESTLATVDRVSFTAPIHAAPPTPNGLAPWVNPVAAADRSSRP
jgi:hypothetical protein